jgi:exodeoxyribonuclease V alpha subunit
MPARTLELTLIYRRERIRWDQTAILECEEPKSTGSGANGNGQAADMFAPAAGVTVKTECLPEELVSGLSYRFYGHWQEHERHGRQFVARTYVRCQPHGKAGVIRYLTTTCRWCGVGHATAAKLWDKFGSDACRIVREQPDVAVAAVGLGHWTTEKAEEAAAVLREESALEAVSIDLIDLLGGKGFPRDTAKKCVGEWGNRAAQLVRRNPYLLMRFRGCGFLRTDQLYLDQGGRPTAMKRQALCGWYAVARDTEGHTWFRPELVEAGIRGRISGATVQPVSAMLLAKRAGMLSVHRDATGNPWLAEARKAKNEAMIAEHVREMLVAPSQWPDVGEIDATPHQRERLDAALQSSVGLLAGSPGTGKTYTLARLVGRIGELHGLDCIALCAPTGKAAVRMAEAVSKYGIPKGASTIHRLLGVASRTAGEGWGFAHDENNPLPHKFVICDETSMVDVDLFASLLRALARGTHLLLVGDWNQLPPVGHGRPFYDLWQAGVPCGELREIKRNAGTIVEMCAAIRDSRPIRFDRELDLEAGRNLKLVGTRNNAESLEAIVERLHRLRILGYDPVWDCQTLVQVNRKSELSRADVNKRLQAEFNPDGRRVAGSPFREGDKIIRVKKNTLMPCAENCQPDENADRCDGKVLVCNGEMGRVVQVESKRVFARFTAPKRCIVIPMGGKDEGEGDDGGGNGDGGSDESTGTGCDFDLGMAVTVHKSQGSEWPVVLFGLDDSGGAVRLGSRELFYTGISRAREFGLAFGKEYTARAMCVRRAIVKRKTFLKELISEEDQ